MSSPALLALEPEARFLENGIILLSVDQRSGTRVYFLGETKSGRNLLNHADRGQYVQQSFYEKPAGPMNHQALALESGSGWHLQGRALRNSNRGRRSSMPRPFLITGVALT
ncbi:MAG: hypothetical protein ABGZ37_09070 [Akkermansiaceae bacterium]